MIYPKSEIRWKGYSQIKSIFLCILRFSCGTCNVSCKYYFIFATLPKFYYLECPGLDHSLIQLVKCVEVFTIYVGITIRN